MIDNFHSFFFFWKDNIFLHGRRNEQVTRPQPHFGQPYLLLYDIFRHRYNELQKHMDVCVIRGTNSSSS